MTELKTLKDIERMCIEQAGFSMPKVSDMVLTRAMLEQLKAEAVKWVKYLLEKGSTEKALILIEFFNLTEADLQ